MAPYKKFRSRCGSSLSWVPALTLVLLISRCQFIWGLIKPRMPVVPDLGDPLQDGVLAPISGVRIRRFFLVTGLQSCRIIYFVFTDPDNYNLSFATGILGGE